PQEHKLIKKFEEPRLPVIKGDHQHQVSPSAPKLLSLHSSANWTPVATPSQAANNYTSSPMKVGLQFPVGRIARFLKASKYAERVGADVPVDLSAVIEYLAAENYIHLGKKRSEEDPKRHLCLDMLKKQLEKVLASKLPEALAAKKKKQGESSQSGLNDGDGSLPSSGTQVN
ncbi:putative histone H2A-like protein, partial [Fagus crenata]